LSVLALITLSACASQAPIQASFAPAGPIECVPFARALTGVNLQGDGPEWWQAAEGRYQRSSLPDVGAIMVFRRSSRLPHGHVSVVSRVVSRREIWVTHANWVHGVVTQDQPVNDVSSANDWTKVRVWWAPSGRLGATLYAVLGFILPERRLGHDAIAARTAAAASTALEQH
jgi:surface antigen